jgi:hypothetical protein
VKLEAEANEMLVQMNKSKTSGAIEAIQNLGDLLSISLLTFSMENDNEIEDIQKFPAYMEFTLGIIQQNLG